MENRFESKREEMRHMTLDKKTDIKEFEWIRMVVMGNQVHNQLNNQAQYDGWKRK